MALAAVTHKATSAAIAIVPAAGSTAPQVSLGLCLSTAPVLHHVAVQLAEQDKGLAHRSSVRPLSSS